MKLTELIIVNEAGEEGKIERAAYIKHTTKEQNVQDHNSEAAGTTEASKVVDHILKSLERGTEIEENIQNEYPQLINLITEDYNRSVSSKADKKAEAEAAKEAKAKEKAEREAQEKAKKDALIATQGEFALAAMAGADLAAKEFQDELESIRDHLPEGVNVVNNGTGYGIEFTADADKLTVGQTLGYLMQKSNNSQFIGNQMTFWVGDTIIKTVALGIYETAKEAAKHIAAIQSEKTGKKIEPASLDQYKRMSERTPVEYRNPKADPTAYLAISTAKAPRKDEKEDQAAFDARLKKFEADRENLQKMLAVGEIVKRKDMVPLVNDLLVKHGMREAVDPNAVPEMSLGQRAMMFFHATFALEELLGTHKDGFITYKKDGEIIEVSKEDMEEKLASAKAGLVNALYTSEKLGLTPADFIKGYKETITKVEVTRDADDKPVMEDAKVKNMVYPTPFFEWVKQEVSGEVAGEAAAPTTAPTKDAAEGTAPKKTKAAK